MPTFKRTPTVEIHRRAYERLGSTGVSTLWPTSSSKRGPLAPLAGDDLSRLDGTDRKTVDDHKDEGDSR